MDSLAKDSDKNAVTGVLFSAATFCIQVASRCWNTTDAGLPVKGLEAKESTKIWSTLAKLASLRVEAILKYVLTRSSDDFIARLKLLCQD